MVRRTFIIVGVGLLILALTALIVFNKPQASVKKEVLVKSKGSGV